MITEQPNETARNLKHKELYDFDKNPFAQFFGRIIFGSEEKVRKYFNADKILWMHAKGSNCHGDPKNDGEKAIKSIISTHEFELIILFGSHAVKLLFIYSLSEMLSLYQAGQVNALLKGSVINSLFKKDIIIKNADNKHIALFPHVSGRAQGSWLQYANTLSQAILSVQNLANEITSKNE